ncbi:SGNH/GDSL hydrolase family protein [Legionella yabuuchiae]|uniref:SGNH/GDSL hydrolase family protein n=1 Tax=Legionella yabuuchiae TaxID=376727 RepID=UPI0013EF6069|nr:SGNH/GDSL hydrolase family protein [Legionella yabuuchiae]
MPLNQGEAQQAINIKLNEIKYITMMGDSLSDRGTVNRAFLFGIIPMRKIAGLEQRSPDGRFTNGLVWGDHVTASIASDFTIKRLEKRCHLRDTDIADAVIMRDQRILRAIYDSYSLDDDKYVRYHNKLWVRSYCEGGLMSHDYSWALSWNLKRFFSRLILSALEDMRHKLLQYDRKHNISCKQKSETLIIEWSGANDLITVNAKPTQEEVNRAIAARMDNVKKLISAGYRNFILFNLPNLSLTPRFYNKSQAERDEAAQCSHYFNTKLQEACAALASDYPYCSIDVFDVNSQFEKIYQNPTKYYFEEEKKHLAYSDSPDFNRPSKGISPARGYIYYDDVHPSADMHALLAAHFYEHLGRQYTLLEPDKIIRQKKRECTEEELLTCFRRHYERRLHQDKQGFFSFLRHSNLDYKNASLETVLRHALTEGGNRTKAVLKELGWLNDKEKIILDSEHLKNAMEAVQAVDETHRSMLSSWMR